MDPLLLAFCYALTGTLIGSTLGLIPGMHSNNVALLFYVLIANIISPINFGCLIMGMLVSHVFTSFIPSTFLGAPQGELALSVLPAHRLMLAGKGYDAVKTHAKGAAGGIFASLLLIPFFKIILGEPFNLYSTFSFIIPFSLIIIEFMLISSEPQKIEWKTKIVTNSKIISRNNESNFLSINEIMKNDEHIGKEVTIQGKVINIRKRTCILTDDTASIKVEFDTLPQSIKKGAIVNLTGLVDHECIVHSWQPRLLALFYFLLTGIFGYFLLNSHLFHFYIPILLSQSGSVFLLPIFAGMFAIAGLFISLLDKPSFPSQEILSQDIQIDKTTFPSRNSQNIQNIHNPNEFARDKTKKQSLNFSLFSRFQSINQLKQKITSNAKYLKGVFAGAITGGLIGFYPGMSSAHASIIAKWASSDSQPENLSKNNIEVDIKEKILENAREFISMLSAVNSANIILNLLALFVISKTRSGAMNYLEIVLGDFVLLGKNNLPISFSTMLFSAIVGASFAYPITLFAGKIFATYYHKLNYEKLTIAVILFLIILVFLFSGPIGLFVMLISTSIGISSQLLGVRRVHLMGCIAIPVFIFYLL